MAIVYQEQEDGKKLHLSGDGRCDTPGFSAKYCHYTLMLDDPKEIIHTELLQVNKRLTQENKNTCYYCCCENYYSIQVSIQLYSTEAGSSVAMEPLGFKRGMKEIMGDGLDIEVMTTDRSTSIRTIMREEFPNVQHEFDIWHTAKGMYFLPSLYTHNETSPILQPSPFTNHVQSFAAQSDLYIADKRMGFGCTLQKNTTNVVRGPNLCYIYSFRFEEEDTEERSN